MGRLSDELIRCIAEGSGRCYSHEGKAMAQEIKEWREKAAAAVKAAAAAAPPAVAPGMPWGLTPP